MGAVSCFFVDLSCIGAGCEPYRLISFPAFTIDALPTGEYYVPLQGAGLCLCNTITYSLLSACDDARDQIGSGTIDVVVLFSTPMYLPLAGRTMRPTARRHCLSLREFPCAGGESNAFYIDAGS